ncbi:MAG: ABC transporter ATP-binding protein [Chloroflexi bacterium]|nr:ABC transporter ATP-binding protein [Chloroflexota bacterium]MBP8056514.1 ABC transporter ATP-binding protein [Chloroflexota bacterium]
MSTPFVILEHVTHTFGNSHPVIADVSLAIHAGEFVALVGRSGIGKSTLLRLMAGLFVPDKGTVRLGGQPPLQSSTRIGLVFQKDNLLPWRTVYDNVRLPLEILGQPAKTIRERVMVLLDLVGLAGFSQHYPAQLSGGMAQRVALARALVHEPSLLLLDEPFGALDALTREKMGQELLRIWQVLPVTVCLVTHSIPEAVLLADRVLVLNDQPGTITGDVPIDLPRPRTLEMQGTKEFFALAAAIRVAIE